MLIIPRALLAKAARAAWGPRRPLRMLLSIAAVLAGTAGVAHAELSGEPFEVLPGSFQISPSTTQAGAHENLTTSFDFAHDPVTGKTHNDVRTIVVNLPAGFDASDTAVPTCPLSGLLGFSGIEGQLPLCPIASQIGQISFELTSLAGHRAHPTVPLYNMEVTSFGIAAELGFKTQVVTTTLLASVRPGDTGLTITTPNIPRDEISDISVTVWGVPAAREHDAQRGEACGAELEVPPTCHNELGGPQEAKIAPKPFLSNPTSCGMFTASVEAYSWEAPQEPSRATTEVGPVGECDRVPFEPTVEATPTTTLAETSSGLSVTIGVPQAWDNPLSLSTANLKDATVTLPEGFTVNPSAGSGLGACMPVQYAAETSSSLPGAGCPPESKIGDVEIETPILDEKLTGAVYVASPYDNPFPSQEHPGGTLLALYIVAKAPPRGVIIKVAGEVHLDETTGQLVTRFLNNPQQPFSKFILKFRPGATAPLVTAPACGTYSLLAGLTPWSAPEDVHSIESAPAFQLTGGVGGGPCPSGGVPPFSPQASVGTTNNAGGSYSPLDLTIKREDGEQELTGFSTIMPPGLTGNLTGIPFCPDAAIEAARGRAGLQNGGARELAEPSCPAASKIGHTIVEAGVGTVLAQTPGALYLAGPYHGAPLSLVSITSAVVGPFDLGTVVIRFALRINPITAQVEVDATGSDPIPHIIQGIVVHVRNIHAYVDRPGFILNPTSCSRTTIANVVGGAGADPADPADQTSVSVTTPFQAADCQSLKFKPEFKVSTSGKTSKMNGASLTAKLVYPIAPQGTQANIKEVKVDLPKQLPSRLTTLQKACTAAQFNLNPAGCPAASNIGYAKAVTPILPVPLEGPVYFVSHGGEAFPSLEIVLQGYGLTIDLVASTFISKAGITSSTFHTVPDQPVTSFEITLPEGKYSALAANGNLCSVTNTVTVKKKVTVRVKGHKQAVTRKVKESVAGSLAMPTSFVAQNGAEIHESTPVSVTGCPKAKPAKKAKKQAKAKSKARKKQ